ncbi:hypothetical protein SAMN02745883_01713 [Caminicella sporogenes DSM 14501]|uniref:Uncharacterized protein n=1 Tax=Caminicella sporogenes DSM 14501 TaxID=1121266 RepID=A0A1M6R6J4_9FIRM|nr:hypothetical protein [Caminicella sporogenes]SHK28091.1 hypothetical protein SAMN02745883_01713 [Caminicella sporogenes DSM 14501]
MKYWIVGAVILLIILTSIQYSLNKIIVLLKETKDILYRLYNKRDYD